MAESAEHLFLKKASNQIIQNFSNTKLYTFTETDRKRFDFSCLVDRDWSRPLVGQVLWRHAEGIDKDVRTLISDDDSEIQLYVASDTISHHSLFEEVISDFRRSKFSKNLWKLKAIWIPGDFDADKEEHRNVVSENIKSQIVNDVLFNIVFDNLKAFDFQQFIYMSGTLGLGLAILHHIATVGFKNITNLSQRLDVSAGSIREKLNLMQGIGVIKTPPMAINYQDTQKGRVILDLFSLIYNNLNQEDIEDETIYIFQKLQCPYILVDKKEIENNIFPSQPYKQAVLQVVFAEQNWGIRLNKIDYSKKTVLKIPKRT